MIASKKCVQKKIPTNKYTEIHIHSTIKHTHPGNQNTHTHTHTFDAKKWHWDVQEEQLVPSLTKL